MDTGVPAVTVLGIVAGNTLEALTGAFLLRRVGGFRPGLERVKDVISLVVFGAMISTVVSATIGVASLLIGGVISWASVPSLWRTWWLGDMGGDLIVAPALLIAANYRRYRRLPGRPFEAVILIAALTGVSALVFSHPTNVVYSLFPLLIWAALRFWQPGFRLETAMTADTAVIKHGELDRAGAERLAQEFERRSRSMKAQLVLDLADVTFVDSAGLQSLIEIERRARERAVRLRTVFPPEHVRAVFRLSGVEPLSDTTDHPTGDSPDLQYSDRVALELAVDDQAPRQARTEVREAIAGRVTQTEAELAVLITSELVTNAVVHPLHQDRASIGL